MLGYSDGDGDDGHGKLHSKNENPWIIKKYAPRIPITTFASFLYLGGMLGSLNFIIGSFIMILMAKIDCDYCTNALYGVGFSVLFSGIGLKYFCLQLWKTIRNQNMDGLIKLVKIGNLIFAGVKDLLYTVLTIFLFLHRRHLIISFGFLVIMAVITGIDILLTCLKIFGIIKRKSAFIKAGLLFNVLTYILAIIGTIILPFNRITSNKDYWLGITVMLFLLISSVYIYINCFIVLLYNMVLEEEESSKKEVMEIDGLIQSRGPSKTIENEYSFIKPL